MLLDRALLEQDVLTKFEMNSGQNKRMPEMSLMLAILEDAVDCFQRPLINEKRRKLFLEAEVWLMSDNKEYFFAFENICEALELDPSYVRRGLVEWQQRRSTSAVYTQEQLLSVKLKRQMI